jgi:DNA (cytosine-5)-methyltransferase 1
VFLENVEGIISAKLIGDGWRDPAGTPVLLHVLRELERMGYRATAGVFSSAEIGASHQRKRVYILAMAHHHHQRLSRYGELGLLNVSEGRQTKEGCVAASSMDGGEQAVADSASGGALPTQLAGQLCIAGGSRQATRPMPPGPDQWWWEPSRVVADSRRGKRGGRAVGAGTERAAQSESGETMFARDENVADSASIGRREGWTESIREQGRFDVTECGECVVEDTQRPIQERWCTVERETASWRTYDQSGGSGLRSRQAESSLGRDVNGCSSRLDYAELCSTVDSRVDELRLLGNGVDPDVVAQAFVTLYKRLIDTVTI